MEFRSSTDVEIFAATVRPWLLGDPVQNTALLSVLELVRQHGAESLISGWVVDDADRIRAAALRTPPFPALVAGEQPALPALVDGWCRLDPDLPAINAMDPVAPRFAELWTERTARRAVLGLAERLFRLESLIPPRPVSGAARFANFTDAELVTRWWSAFGAEAGVEVGDAARHVRDLLGERRISLWVDDGEPVCLANRSLVVAGVGRVGPVYTPPEHRGRGYASNLTAVVTAAILEEGNVPLLFTDLANPTSNGVYTALGYRPVADASLIRFDA